MDCILQYYFQGATLELCNVPNSVWSGRIWYCFLFAVRYKSHTITQVRQLPLHYTKRPVQSSRSHVLAWIGHT